MTMLEPAKNEDPVGEVFDPFTGPQLVDPYPVYARARHEEPVFYSEKQKMWYVTRYDDIVAIAKDYRRFSSRGAIDVPLERTERTRRGIAESWLGHGALTNNDPPQHDIIRRLVMQAFTNKQTARAEELVQRNTDRLLDSFIGDGKVELVHTFNFPVTLQNICGHVGVGTENPAQLRQWSDDWLAINHLALTPDEQHAVLNRLLECQVYLIDLIEEKRTSPQGDLLSDIVRAAANEKTRIPQLQLVNLVMTLYVAGHTTTADMLSLLFHHLLTNREQWQLVLDDESNIVRAVEEALQVESPVQALFRTTTEPVTVTGVDIPARERVALLFASGNADEKYFDHDRVFDMRHTYPKTRPHLTFGHGLHFCIGAPFARLTGRVTLETFARRLPGLRLSSEHTTTYVTNHIHRGMKELRLEWDVPQGGLT